MLATANAKNNIPLKIDNALEAEYGILAGVQH